MRTHHETRSPDHRGHGRLRPADDYRGDLDADGGTDLIVKGWLAQQHMIPMDKDRLAFALSCIETGLHNIERGRAELGARGIREGVEFIRGKIGEARS